MVATLDADACLRVLLADVGHFTMARKPPGAPSLLIVDIFSASRAAAAPPSTLLGRGRGAGTGVILASQSPAALGEEDERPAAGRRLGGDRIPQPQPAELAALAGSERVAEAAWQADAGDLTGRSTITICARARADQDQVRGAPIGIAHIIAALRMLRQRFGDVQVLAVQRRGPKERRNRTRSMDSSSPLASRDPRSVLSPRSVAVSDARVRNSCLELVSDARVRNSYLKLSL